MPDAELRLLGTLEIRVGSSTFELPSRRQRALLARLLLAQGRAVPTAELVASLYGDEAPSNARHALHELVSSLRRSLEPMGLDRCLESGRGSYRFAVDPPQLDTMRFEALLATAEHDDPQLRAEALQQALRLWRGPALADVEVDRDAAAEVERLEELRAGALADWLDLELDAGRHRAALGELERATRVDPYNERLRSQLMLALYRDGRQSDALRVYHEIRKLLAEDLGLEPGDELRGLERRILNHDPALRANGAPRPHRGARLPRHRRAAAAVAALVVLGTGVAVAASMLTSGTSAEAVFSDSLKGREIDTRVWDVEAVGNGPTVAAERDGIHLTIPAHATPGDSTGALKARISTYCSLAGAFDVQVDYALETWPGANGVAVGMYAAWADALRESTPLGDYYVGARRILDPPDGTPRSRVKTDDMHGALRIVRAANRMVVFDRAGGGWSRLYSFPDPTPAPVPVYIELYTTDRRFSHRQVEVRLSDFRVNSGSLQCT